MNTELEDTQVKLARVKEALLVEEDPEARERFAALVTELEELIDLLTATSQQTSSSKPGESSKKASAYDGAAKTWNAGDECMAKTGNRGWQRARVANVGGAEGNRVFSVIFKDNGQTELLKASDLKPLPPSMQNGTENAWGATKKRKFSSKEEEEEAERRKKRNAKKLEVREVKAQEQKAKQDSWKKFTTKAAKKGIEVAGVSGRSIFKTPDNPLGKVGVTGSGKGMTENAVRPKNKFSKDVDNGY